jgi:hypothetical protein
MKIFVGYSFKDKWIEDLVIPLIETYGVHVEHGKELPGERIDDAIKKRIEGADAVVVFLTRVKPLKPRGFQPSDWVVQELTHADAKGNSRILEVREAGVKFTGALHGNLQQLTVNPRDRAPFLLQLGRAVSSWRGAGELKIRLLSEDFASSIRPMLTQKQYQCSYQLRRGATVIDEIHNVEIAREAFGLFIYTKALPPDVLISVIVHGNNETWTSPGIAVAAHEALMEKD